MHEVATAKNPIIINVKLSENFTVRSGIRGPPMVNFVCTHIKSPQALMRSRRISGRESPLPLATCGGRAVLYIQASVEYMIINAQYPLSNRLQTRYAVNALFFPHLWLNRAKDNGTLSPVNLLSFTSKA